MQGQNRSRSAEERRDAEEDARRVTPQVIVNAIDELLLLQRGASSGSASATISSRRSSPTSARKNKLDDEAKFQQALAQEGMTMDDLRKQLERRC
jgi:hypothetical protein